MGMLTTRAVLRWYWRGLKGQQLVSSVYQSSMKVVSRIFRCGLIESEALGLTRYTELLEPAILYFSMEYMEWKEFSPSNPASIWDPE